MSILSDEINNDPTGKGYAGLLPDQPGKVVVLLNALTETKVGLLDRADLAIWSVQTGMRSVIQDESEDKASPLRDSALAILDVLRGASSGIDFTKTENMAVINAWEALGKLSADNKALMLAAATQPASRAEVLGLPYVTEEMLRNR
jgi:hypothetical protein